MEPLDAGHALAAVPVVAVGERDVDVKEAVREALELAVGPEVMGDEVTPMEAAMAVDGCVLLVGRSVRSFEDNMEKKRQAIIAKSKSRPREDRSEMGRISLTSYYYQLFQPSLERIQLRQL